MASLNKAFLIGSVGKDPETRQFNDGGQVCNFTLATSRSYTDRDGQKQEQTTWHNIVLNGKLANLSQYIHKGSKLYIEGEIRNRSFQTQDGQTRYVTEVIALGVQLLDPKPQTQPMVDQNPAPRRPAPQMRLSRPTPPSPVPPPTPGDMENWNSPDLPF